MDIESFDIFGCNVRPVSCSMLTHSAAPSHIAIVLPGFRHTVDRPDLHYAQRILYQGGADILRVEYQYWRAEYATLSEAAQDACIASDATAVVDAAFARRAYSKLTLLGKSLGTIAMAHLLHDERCRAADCIWETPPLTVPWLRDQIRLHQPRSLFVVGTDDSHYDESILLELERATGGQTVRVVGADHSLEVPGDIEASLVGLTSIAQAVESFVLEGRPRA